MKALSRKHNPEFTMLEIYEAYGDCRTIMELVEALVTQVAEASDCGLRIEHGENVIDLKRPWRRVKYRDLICEYMKDPDWFAHSPAEMVASAADLELDISDKMLPGEITHEIYEKCIEPGLIQPTFVLDLPAELVPLAKSREDDSTLVDVFELVVNGSELAPGYSELNDPIEQRRRFQLQAGRSDPAGEDLPEEAGKIDEEFLAAMETGMPPAGGTRDRNRSSGNDLNRGEQYTGCYLVPQLRPKIDRNEERMNNESRMTNSE